MTRRRTVVLAVGVLAATVLTPVALYAAPAAPDVPNPQQYVHTISLGDATENLVSQKPNAGKTTVTINSDVLFAVGQATLSAAAKKALDGIAGKLASAKGGLILIDGYTDSSGAPAFNQKLSTKRAKAVSAYLSREVTGKKFSAFGYGETHPVAPNTKDGKDNPAGRAKNRRVTIVY